MRSHVHAVVGRVSERGATHVIRASNTLFSTNFYPPAFHSQTTETPGRETGTSEEDNRLRARDHHSPLPSTVVLTE